MSKTKDVGWMYYTPSERIEKEAVAYPPPSQIPGLGSYADNEPPIEPTKMWIKESDSPYVRLAKQGGRQDLLEFTENKPNKEAKGYPRCEWFYQEDNRTADINGENGPHIFKLPEYMVHKDPATETVANATQQYQPRAAVPYAADNTTAYERDVNCTDKTVNIPNARRAGYGVRKEKQLQATPTKSVVNTVNGKPSRSRGIEGPDLTDDGGPTDMIKLMAGTYEREWQERRRLWHEKHPLYPPQKVERAFSEYHETFDKVGDERLRQARKVHKNSAAHDWYKDKPEVVDEPLDTPDNVNREIVRMEKELFKLSRFKNVNAKVDSQRVRSPTYPQLYQPSTSSARKRKPVAIEGT